MQTEKDSNTVPKELAEVYMQALQGRPMVD